MREAYRRIRKDAAAGVDGVTAAQYEADLEANLSGLLERFKSGRYRAPAVRRVHLEKPGTSKTRPIGIPTLEDKILQRAVLMVLEPVYEQDFLDCSYGFRPGRGAHQALQSLWEGLMEFGGGWVIDLDIEDFFGSVDWGHLRSFLDRRVQDGVNGASRSQCVPASCITFLSEQAFAPQNTRFWSRRRVWFQFTVGEDKPPMLSVDNRGKGVLSMDCSAKRSPL